MKRELTSCSLFGCRSQKSTVFSAAVLVEMDTVMLAIMAEEEEIDRMRRQRANLRKRNNISDMSDGE